VEGGVDGGVEDGSNQMFLPPFILGGRKRPKKTPGWILALAHFTRSIVPAHDDPRRAKPEQRAWHRKQGKIRRQWIFPSHSGGSVTWALSLSSFFISKRKKPAGLR